MPGIDTSRPFIPVRIAVLTVSDSRGLAEDRSGQTLIERLETAGHILGDRKIVRDELTEIQRVIKGWLIDPDIDVIISTEAISVLLDKRIEGFGERFRQLSGDEIGSSTIQSRCLGGLANATVVFCLPGSTGAVKDAWDDILVHQLDYRFMPCNFVELFDRLQEHQKRSKD